MSDWIVKITEQAWGGYIDFFIYRRVAGGTEVISEDSKGNKIMVKLGEGEYRSDLKPTLRLNQVESGQIMKAFAEAISDHGVSTDNDARMKGLLEATRAHLEDMRKLVLKSAGIQ